MIIDFDLIEGTVNENNRSDELNKSAFTVRKTQLEWLETNVWVRAAISGMGLADWRVRMRELIRFKNSVPRIVLLCYENDFFVYMN